MTSLTTASVTTVLPVKDMDRARDFYEHKLGLEPRGAMGDDEYVFACGGDAQIALIAKPEGTKAEHTALSFEVEEIEPVVKELESRGIQFEDYDTPELKTENHISVQGSDKAAWFKDTEGNFLCVHEHSG